jgi:hypothetical protein
LKAGKKAGEFLSTSRWAWKWRVMMQFLNTSKRRSPWKSNSLVRIDHTSLGQIGGLSPD